MGAYEVYLKNSRIPKLYQGDIKLIPSNADYNAFIKLNEIKKNIKQFVDEGQCLLIYSNYTGNGKTTWSTKLLKAYMSEVSSLGFSNNTPAVFINVNNFINKTKIAISDLEVKEEVNNLKKLILDAKLVVFDELGDKNLSEYDLSLLYDLIDTRVCDMKSCIYTSNQEPLELAKTLDGKLYSRVVQFTKNNHIKLTSRADMRGE